MNPNAAIRLPRLPFLPLLAALVAAGPCLAQDEEPPDLSELHGRGAACWETKDWDEAVRIYAEILEHDPEDRIALYNTACAHSLAGRPAEAVRFLERAVEAGFVDFGHIETDSDLDAIRGEKGYERLLADRDAILARDADRRIERYREQLGDDYRIVKDEEYRLILVSDVSEEDLARLQASLRAYAESHWKDFFGFRPGYYLVVLIPSSAEDYAERFGGWSGAAGFYQHTTHTLTVNLATGTGTMIHEYTHALHYGDMEGLGQEHPQWVIEGFGSLFEQCTQRQGSGYGLLNWRLPILKESIEQEKNIALRDFLSRSDVHFDTDQGVAYAHARYVLYFLQEKGLLRKWYAAYRKGFADDPTGIAALEAVYGDSIEAFETEWLEFLEPLEFRRPGAARSGPWLGIGIEAAERGIEVTRVVEGSPAAAAGLATGDVVVGFDGREIASLEDLSTALARRTAGDEVPVVVLRDGVELGKIVTLGRRPDR